MVHKTNDQNDGESSDEELLDEGVVEAYRQLNFKWKEEFMIEEKQKEKINVLLQEKTNLITIIS